MKNRTENISVRYRPQHLTKSRKNQNGHKKGAVDKMIPHFVTAPFFSDGDSVPPKLSVVLLFLKQLALSTHLFLVSFVPIFL